MKSKILSVLLIFLILSLTACKPSENVVNDPLEDEGNHIDTSEFSLIKWVCNEADLYFYTLDFGATQIIGEYNRNGEKLRVVGMFSHMGVLDFGLYSKNGDVNEGINLPSALGYIYTEHTYENEIITCRVNAVEGIDLDEETLTFEKQSVAKTVKAEWKCDEIDMTMRSFNEVEGYYVGEIVIDEKKCNFMAFEVKNGHYRFHVENGVLNNLTDGTEPLIDMTLTEKDGKLVGSLSQFTISDSINFPYWDFENTTINFTKQ